MKEESIKARYLRDPLPVRLGGLSANLARVRSFSDHPDHQEVVAKLLGESMLFIEWTAEAVTLDVRAQLVELQVQLAQWRHECPALWADAAAREAMARQADAWSQRVLEMSGPPG
jgi:hypothetical protein